ncbi:MAG TPA: NmrA family NAD(P)-binding protein [Polyangiales bacterium]
MDISRGKIRKILVYGANGVQGRAIARELRSQAFDVRAAVRDTARATALEQADIQLVSADLENPDSLRRASAGRDAVVLTVPLEFRREVVLRWVTAVANAARAEDVKLLVLNSTRLSPEPTELPMFELRRDVEALVRRLGPPSIVLRSPIYLENLESPPMAASIAREGVVAYPLAARLRVSWMSVADLGAYVGAALRRPDLVGASFDIGGPQVLDGPALARELAHVAGKPVSYVAIPPEMIEKQLTAGLGSSVAQSIARSYAWLALHAETTLLSGTSAELARDLRRPPISAAAWARTQAWAAEARAHSA